jgi:hypothetical protein
VTGPRRQHGLLSPGLLTRGSLAMTAPAPQSPTAPPKNRSSPSSSAGGDRAGRRSPRRARRRDRGNCRRAGRNRGRARRAGPRAGVPSSGFKAMVRAPAFLSASPRRPVCRASTSGAQHVASANERREAGAAWFGHVFRRPITQRGLIGRITLAKL